MDQKIFKILAGCPVIKDKYKTLILNKDIVEIQIDVFHDENIITGQVNYDYNIDEFYIDLNKEIYLPKKLSMVSNFIYYKKIYIIIDKKISNYLSIDAERLLIKNRSINNHYNYCINLYNKGKINECYKTILQYSYVPENIKKIVKDLIING